MSSIQILKIVSGGQTGVDRVALDVAIFRQIPHGGWCPKGRRAEEGEIPDIYNLRETESRHYSERTEKNVVDSDGTLILYHSQMSRGTELTRRLALRHRRPLKCVDLSREDWADETADTKQWIVESNISVLNVAGPRKSSCPDIVNLAQQFLLEILPEEETSH